MDFVASMDTPLEEVHRAEAKGLHVSYPPQIREAFDKMRASFARRLAESGYDVDLAPGRATVRGPEPFEVELEYALPKGVTGTIREAIGAATITGDFPNRIDLGPYVEAFVLKLLSEPRAKTLRVPTRRPKPGRPFDEDFYRRVLALHNRFRDEGRTDPSAAVAQLMDETPEQVRLWVWRARDRYKKKLAKEDD